MRSPALLAMTLALLTSAAQAQIAPVLTIHFDKDFHGVGPQGAVVRGTPVGKPELAEGKFGRALKTGSPTGFVDYPTKGILNPRRGTIEMWVCPVDWLPDDGKFHAFFAVRGQGALYLYKYFSGTRLLMLTGNDVKGPFTSSQFPVNDWKPGQWHHLAGSWSPQGVLAYVDGKPADKQPLAGLLPTALDPTFRIGDQPWQFPRATTSLIDEVRIYDRTLTPAQIAAHFAGNYQYAVPLSKETVQIDIESDPLRHQAEVRVDTGGADVDDARLELQLAIVPAGGSFPDQPVRAKFDGGQAVVILPLSGPGVASGAYQVVARIVRNGMPVVEASRALIIPETSWLGSTVGRADVVLPPWTPLKVSTAKPDKQIVAIGCWGRSYEFQHAAFPSQITSAGEPLLARPIALRFHHGEQDSTWQQQSLTAVRASPTTALLQGVLAASGPSGGNFKTSVRAEYDGLLLIELSADGPMAPPAQRLSLEIPVRAKRAIYRHRWSPHWTGVSGNVPARQGVVDCTSFVPFAWLGDNDRGLFWFCESDEMWPNAKAKDAIELVRSANEVTLRLNLLAAGQKLPPKWKFVFGLQATPVKPIPKDWRKWRLSPGRKANLEIVWPAPNKFSQFGYPEAADPQAFTQYIQGLHKSDVKAIPYLCLTYMTGAAPEWQFFRKLWEMGPADPSIPKAGWNHTFHMVSPVGLGYADFMISKTKRFLEAYGIDGVYHDQTHPYTSSAVASGVGYVRDGKRYPSYPILGYRDLYRRDYAVVKGLPRETFTMAHMSGKITIPILAYDDSYLDGENFRDVVKDSYLDVVSLDAFRAEFMGRQWGLMPFFLPEFDAEHRTQVEPTRGMMALLMLHDVSLWPIWCNVKVVNEALAALDEFGYVAADFIPYFAPVPPATTNMADVYVSAYKRPEGQVLLIVGNLSKEDRQGEVRIEAGTLGIRLGKIVTWPQKEPVASQGGCLKLDVPRLGYRMLLVEKAP